jgi:osmoprotectant transport system ATP-binding protein
LVVTVSNVLDLRLISYQAAMSPVPENYQPGSDRAIAQHDNLREALSLLLRTGAETLSVVNDGKVVGILTLSSIRDSARIGANR